MLFSVVNFQQIIALLKLRARKLIHQKQSELSLEIEAFQSSHPAGIEKFESDKLALY